jgi:hypothetical protein
MPTDSPLLIEGPKAESSDTPIIDLEAAPASTETAAAQNSSRWQLPGYTSLAAAVAFAAVLGGIAGAVTSNVMQNPAAPPEVANTTQAIKASVAHLSSEIASLKTGIASAQRTASTQFGKLAERLDRTEKAQAEPTAKLAKIQESLERLDRKQLAAAASDITGSVTPKDESKPQVVEGWRLRDYYDGRAVVENRNGTLYKIGPGANVPGLGKIESIKREHGKVTVVTANGIIASSPEQRRPYYMPRW